MEEFTLLKLSSQGKFDKWIVDMIRYDYGGWKRMRRKDREVTDSKDIIGILEKCKTANVAMIDHGMPYVVPLSYGYELLDEQLVLYFHSATEGHKIDILRENNKVCFAISCEGEPLHADIPCNSGYYYSSIIGNGQVEFVDNMKEKSKALQKMFYHQTGRKVEFTEEQAKTVCIFKIISEDFSGKQKRMKE